MRSKGFTLIELMIAVVVVSILAAIVYPSYRDYVIKSRRTDAMTTLMNVHLAQEKYRATHTGYADSLGALNLSAVSESGFYDVAITDAASNTFTATATPKSGTSQADDACNFSVNQNGPVKDDSDSKACWGG